MVVLISQPYTDYPQVDRASGVYLWEELLQRTLRFSSAPSYNMLRSGLMTGDYMWVLTEVWWGEGSGRLPVWVRLSQGLSGMTLLREHTYTQTHS